MKPVRIGCSGWNYDDWRGGFYPQSEPRRRWLALYAERFDTVEVNTTFYRLPNRDSVAAWVRDSLGDLADLLSARRSRDVRRR